MRHLVSTAILAVCLLLGGCGGSTDPLQKLDAEHFVYQVMRDYYLHYDEVPTLDPAAFASPQAVLDACVVGAPRDRWSYLTDTAAFDVFFSEGEYLGYGFTTSLDDAGWVCIALVQPGSPAALAGAQRGDRILAIDGLDFSPPVDAAAYRTALGPDQVGYEADFTLDDGGGARSVSITKAIVTISPVPSFDIIDNDGTPVGYLVFTDFIATSSAQLDTAVAAFSAANVRNLVVDLRYNRGGRLDIATHAASLLHNGSTSPLVAADLLALASSDQVFCVVRYNDTGWHRNTTYYFETLATRLDPERIVFLTSGSTASAAELLINCLAPYRSVTIIGETTHGKPVGMSRFDHEDSGLTLLPLTCALTNVLGDGDYYAGIPADLVRSDDLDHALGDPAESLLAEALSYLDTGVLSATTAKAVSSDPARDSTLLYPAGLAREIGKH
jgi:C-terminal processing protease CtpA/Prc